MYISMSRLRLPVAQVPELLEAFRNRAGLVGTAAGSSISRCGTLIATRAK